MKYLQLIVGVIAGVAAVTVFNGVTVERIDSAAAPAIVEPLQVHERVAPPEAARPTELLSAPGAAHRTPVPVVDAEDIARELEVASALRQQYEDMIATEDYDALRDTMMQAQSEANVLRARVAHLERELCLANLDESTPVGHFAHLPEADGIDDTTLRTAQSWLDQFPVMLAPHEATWLIERIEAKDWSDWPGHGSKETVITYLGPDRLKAELPPELTAELVAYYADEPWVIK